MSTTVGALFYGLIGLMVGSFLNVVAHRVPLGESLVSPGSHCPGCAAEVKPYDNIPVVSWLLLRGRCRGCAEPISARYPLVDLRRRLAETRWPEPETSAIDLGFPTNG